MIQAAQARVGEADHGRDPAGSRTRARTRRRSRASRSPRRLVADMLQLAGVDRVLTMDLHAGQIQGFFTIPVDHMTALPLFAQHFRDLGLPGEGVVSVAPDAGRAKLAVRVRRDDRRRLRDHEQDAPGARRRRRSPRSSATSRQDRDHRRRHHRHGRHAHRGRAGAPASTGATRGLRSSRRTALFNGDALERLAEREHRAASSSPTRSRSTRSTQPDNLDGADGLRPPRRDDHERLRRRLGLGDLRRREPALLARTA